MSFAKENVRNLMIRDKLFLKALYEGQNILKTADDAQLHTVIKYLHFLANGEVKLKRDKFKALEDSKILHFIQMKLEKKQSIVKLIKESRITKLRILQKLMPYFKILLFPIFNQQ